MKHSTCRSVDIFKKPSPYINHTHIACVSERDASVTVGWGFRYEFEFEAVAGKVRGAAFVKYRTGRVDLRVLEQVVPSQLCLVKETPMCLSDNRVNSAMDNQTTPWLLF